MTTTRFAGIVVGLAAIALPLTACSAGNAASDTDAVSPAAVESVATTAAERTDLAGCGAMFDEADGGALADRAGEIAEQLMAAGSIDQVDADLAAEAESVHDELNAAYGAAPYGSDVAEAIFKVMSLPRQLVQPLASAGEDAAFDDSSAVQGAEDLAAACDAAGYSA
ncbi:hypothetical protein [Demequina pelophila]|uniref:hypothetical protein n=1 Tax=Demequina pelophila TaxID=1638984 RepID=UPI0007802972|nr:hypothetical protein [Demequina pelophila]